MQLTQTVTEIYYILLNLQHDRINKIHASLSSQNRSKEKVVKIYHNLDLADLIDELHQRNIQTKTMTKQ